VKLLAALLAVLLATTGICAEPAQLKGFPRDALTIERSTGRDTFQIWIADTPARQQQGLMWIRNLPADRGMLFVHPESRELLMWMKNTFIPLDMLFIDDTGRIVHIAKRTTPQSEAIISSGKPAKAVLEIAGGEADRRGITIGNRVVHKTIGDQSAAP
jgi:uncharacterized protein